MQEALGRGEAENPTILSAIFRERSQDHIVKQTKGELLPSVDLQANYTRSYDSGSSAIDREEVTTVTGRVTVPIYEAGEVSARIRQNIETRSQLRHQIDEARELVRANVTLGLGNSGFGACADHLRYGVRWTQARWPWPVCERKKRSVSEPFSTC